MMRYRNIAVAFDGSVDSVKAMEVATTLSEDHDAELTVIYVTKPVQESKGMAGAVSAGDPNLLQSQTTIEHAPLSITTPGIIPDQEHVQAQDNVADQVITKAKENMSGNMNVTYKILKGKPETEIANYTKKHSVDLMVIGNRGFSGIKKVFMGSVSQKVTNDAECSVYVVK